MIVALAMTIPLTPPNPAHTDRQQALANIAKELKHPTPAAVISGGLEILRSLRAQQAILGTAQR